VTVSPTWVPTYPNDFFNEDTIMFEAVPLVYWQTQNLSPIQPEKKRIVEGTNQGLSAGEEVQI
jgi:hypothetical protein